ncbi:single-stranded-DNA-specific exonuclease RecJ [Eubacteriales bacterium OttesenSCG-928-N13]|nr:single-stranded-DNA-specific exonuclease RecJ [Eubacteriales bacterium OttesenSCG-928-N13]
MLRLIHRAQAEARFERPDGMPRLLHELLCARGIDSLDAAEQFLNPSIDQLHDPLLLGGMNDALSLIHRARSTGGVVCVFGDYDVDGVCATAILAVTLRQMGIDARSYIPSRHEEGYGLSDAAVEEIANWAQLLITVDCGITALDQVSLAQAHGMQVVVTDHHQPPEQLPDCAVINPLLDGYPFPSLCGAGVAWKVAMALDERIAMGYIDLAALATVADLVPLTQENRVIVSLGLHEMRKAPRPGVKALMDIAGVQQDTVDAGRIAYQMAPRLNAGGRLGDARRSMDLLTANALEKAVPLAEELEQENTERRAVEQQILEEAFAQMQGFDFANHRSIVLHGANWNVGVIGLAASRLVEKYHLPTVMLSGEGETLHGSCRSVPGVDIHEALSACESLLVRFGGHKQAAGLTIESSQLDAFRTALDRFITQSADPICFVPGEAYDLDAMLQDVDEHLVELLQRLEPFGMGNPGPLLLSTAKVDQVQTVGKQHDHLQLRLSDQNAQRRAIGFRMAANAPDVGETRRILYRPKLNTWNGHTSVQLELRALMPPEHEQALAQFAAQSDALLQSFLTQRLYNRAYAPNLGETIGNGDEQSALNRMMQSPCGTLLVFTDYDRLGAFLRNAQAVGGADRFDLMMGCWPKGELPQNAVCYAPIGQLPKGYSQLYCADAPCSLIPDRPPNCHQGSGAAWTKMVPDTDALRTLYRMLRDLASRPSYLKTIQGLVQSLEADGMLHGIQIATGLTILHDLKLIELSIDPPAMNLLPMHKCDPAGSPIYQYLHSIK